MYICLPNISDRVTTRDSLLHIEVSSYHCCFRRSLASSLCYYCRGSFAGLSFVPPPFLVVPVARRWLRGLLLV
jgi:hypothetical protein